MTRHVLTMAGAKYDPIVEQWVDKGSLFGFDEAWVYDDVWLSKHPFWTINAWLHEHPGDLHGRRGLGWYAWKALIIQHCFDLAKPGDIVLYVDGDTQPIADLAPIWAHAGEHGAMHFAASAHKNHRWCKRDTFITMGLDDMWGRTDMQAGVARFCAFRRGDGVSDWRERQFLQEWLVYSINRYATTFDASLFAPVNTMWPLGGGQRGTGWFGPQDHPEFEEHRTEQAIQTLLCHKYGYPLHREADQSGEEQHFYTTQPGNYPQLFKQTHLGSGHPVEGSRYRRVPG